MKKAIAGLTYPSESDAPFDVFCWKRTAEDPVKEVASRVKGAPVQRQTADEFFSELLAGGDGPKFQSLRRTLESLLSELRVFRAGEVEVQVYVIGKTPAGRAGMHTVSVET